MPTLAAAVTDFAATLKAENDRAEAGSSANPSPFVFPVANARDESAGQLSPAEIAIAAEIAPQSDHLWQMYRDRLAAAEVAREALRARLRHGIAPITELPRGGVGGMALLENAEARDLIDAHASANRRLYDAARTLVDCLELPEDGGPAVVWELRMGSGR